MLRSMKTNTYVDVSKMTVGEFIEEWFTVAKTELRAGTVERYQSIIDRRLKDSALARMPLQKVRPTNVEQYYASHASLAAGTLGLDHAILHSAMAMALRDRLITENPAANIRRKRRDRDRSIEAQKHAWSAIDAAKFLAVAKKAGAQSGAFYTVALETGMRKSELGGLRWANVDLDGAKVQVVEQLTKKGSEPEWGPTKTGKPRTIAIGTETVALLREHRRAQAELKMKNRATYKDHRLVREGMGRRAATWGIPRPAVAVEQHRAARIRPAHPRRRHPSYQVPRTPAHVRDVTLAGPNAGPRRIGTAGTLEGDDDARGLRARLPDMQTEAAANPRRTPPRLGYRTATA
jgi:integrase